MGVYNVQASRGDGTKMITFKVSASSSEAATFLVGKFVAAADLMQVTDDLSDFCDLTDPAAAIYLSVISELSLNLENVSEVR